MKQEQASVRKLSRRDWLKRGKELYGTDLKTWKFRCPRCGHVQSIESVGSTSAADWIFTACEGRRRKGHGCNWSLGGLVKLHTLEVEFEEEMVPCFEYADDPEAPEVKDDTRTKPLLGSAVDVPSSAVPPAGLPRRLQFLGHVVLWQGSEYHSQLSKNISVRVTTGNPPCVYVYESGTVLLWRIGETVEAAISKAEQAYRNFMREGLQVLGEKTEQAQQRSLGEDETLEFQGFSVSRVNEYYFTGRLGERVDICVSMVGISSVIEWRAGILLDGRVLPADFRVRGTPLLAFQDAVRCLGLWRETIYALGEK